ncbi:VMO1 protein, partial [Lophotis ruficrista]|nr:VMO1 protein [Lophotis ruficrista]
RAAMPGAQILLLLAGLAGAAGPGWEPDRGGSDASVITVSNEAPWGDRAWPEMCPKGSYTSGVSFRVEPPKGVTEDDTALNGIWLHCSRGGDPSSTSTANSQSSRWGCWLEAHWCPHGGRLVGFTLWVQAHQLGLLSDEVAATSARFACSDGHILLGSRSTWGQGSVWSPQCPRAVCGIQMRQEPAQGLKRDGKALHDLCLFCC